ncbi:MAG: M20/M25/M40 family metallo-hydrolase [Geobacteraceae bacterium]|nr:M20/M25/M40 family metallo-hydrolase [Geobacteraceae bacterium]
MKCTRMFCAIVITLTSTLFFAACDGQKATPVLELDKTISSEALVGHAQVLENISLGNALSRSSNSPGYLQAMDYIKDRLRGTGLRVWEQRFEYRNFFETQNPVLSMVSPEQEVYVWGTDYQTIAYSGIGDVSAEIVFVTPDFPPGVEPNTSTDGCESADFEGVDVAGKIAVIQRGTCDFSTKALNAESRGAVAVLLFNEGQEGRTDAIVGTLSADLTMGIPVVGIRYELGKTLYDRYAAGSATTLRVAVNGINAIASTYNLFAETVAGRSDQVVLIGAHLDSVIEGPGINDNGSGTAALLEVSRQLGLSGYTPKNKIRFAWWGAEEVGTVGSQHYLDTLSPEELRTIALYLNVDCIASHNFVRGVEDSDLSDTMDDPSNRYATTPAGSGTIERVLLDYFHANNLPTKPTPLTGSTDYQAFADRGIPFGGLFTELDGKKTEAEALLFGGTAGEPYDSCYHAACDTVTNMNTRIFTENARAIAHFAQYFGDRKVTALLDSSRANVSKHAVTVETVKTSRDRYHKDRMYRASR